MPLDPSIFLQGAALQQRNNDSLLNSIQNVAAMKMEKDRSKATGLDLDKLIEPILIKQASGEQLTPQELAVGKAWDLKNSTKLTTDAAGNYRKANDAIFGGSAGGGISILPPGTQAPSQKGLDFSSLGDVALNLSANDFNGEIPMGRMDNIPLPPRGGEVNPQGLDFNRLMPQSFPGNPNATQKSMESAATGNIELQKKRAEADIGTSQAGAEAYSKAKAEAASAREETIIGLDQVLDSIGNLEKSISGTPSGGLQSTAAAVSNFLGKPNSQALAQADIDATMPVLLSNVKAVIRQKGEGTFSDSDQRLLDRMMPKDSDSTAVKIRKLVAVKKEMESMKSRRMGATDAFKAENSAKPGFKYIGVKQ